MKKRNDVPVHKSHSVHKLFGHKHIDVFFFDWIVFVRADCFPHRIKNFLADCADNVVLVNKDAAKLLFAHFCPFVNKMRWIFAVIAAHALALKNGVINIPVKLFVQKRINDDFRKIHHFLTGWYEFRHWHLNLGNIIKKEHTLNRLRRKFI